MLIKFSQEYLEEIYATGKCSDKNTGSNRE